MDWTTLAWAPYAGSLPDVLAPHVELFRSALEEGASAGRSAPVAVRALEVATARQEPVGTAEAGDGEAGRPARASATPTTDWRLGDVRFLPLTSFELLGTSRRGVWVALDPGGPTELAGSSVDAPQLGVALVRALDEALEVAVGAGLSLSAADVPAPEADSELLLVRLDLASGEATPCRLVFAVPAAAETEMAAHLAALAALSGAPAVPEADVPVPARAVAPAPAPAAPAPATTTARRPTTAPPSVPVSPGTHLPQVAAAAAASAGSTSPDEPAASVRPVAFDELTPQPAAQPGASIDLLLGVDLEVTVEIGRARLPIREILGLVPGSIVELDKLAGEQVDVLVNGHAIAQGEVVVVDENFGVRIMSIVSRHGRISSAGAA